MKGNVGRVVLNGAILMILVLLVIAIGNGIASDTAGTGEVKRFGVIDSISTTFVIIEDSLFRFSSSVRFLSGRGNRIPLAYFVRGDRVEYSIDTNGDISALRQVED